MQSNKKSCEKEVIVHLAGGLGNQLFQYFAGINVASSTGRKLVLKCQNIDYKHTGGQHDISSFGIHALVVNKLPHLISQARRPYVAIKVRLEYLLSNFFGFNVSRGTIQGNYIEVVGKLRNIEESSRKKFQMKGFFQDFDFYANSGENFKRLNLVDPSDRYISLQRECYLIRPVAIHLRLGDFLQGGNPSSIGNLAPDYYRNCLAELNDEGIKGPFWIFSNELDEAKDFFASVDLGEDFRFIISGTDVDPAEDLLLMASCKALITANSTFSFWAAALAPPSNFILCPEALTISGIYEVRNLPPNWRRVQSLWR